MLGFCQVRSMKDYEQRWSRLGRLGPTFSGERALPLCKSIGCELDPQSTTMDMYLDRRRGHSIHTGEACEGDR